MGLWKFHGRAVALQSAPTLTVRFLATMVAKPIKSPDYFPMVDTEDHVSLFFIFA